MGLGAGFRAAGGVLIEQDGVLYIEPHALLDDLQRQRSRVGRRGGKPQRERDERDGNQHQHAAGEEAIREIGGRRAAFQGIAIDPDHVFPPPSSHSTGVSGETPSHLYSFTWVYQPSSPLPSWET